MRSAILLFTIFPYLAHAQSKNDRPKARDTAIQCNAYKNSKRGEVLLQHCPFSDEGNFVLKLKDGSRITGTWTVLRGSVTNRNATVVELSGNKQHYYYLRTPSGDLSELDSTLHKMLPEPAHYFTKEKFHLGIQKEFKDMRRPDCSL